MVPRMGCSVHERPSYLPSPSTVVGSERFHVAQPDPTGTVAQLSLLETRKGYGLLGCALRKHYPGWTFSELVHPLHPLHPSTAVCVSSDSPLHPSAAVCVSPESLLGPCPPRIGAKMIATAKSCV